MKVSGRPLPDVPLVANGERGASDSAGYELITLQGGTALMSASDPILSIAHIKVTPDRSLKVEIPTGGGGNSPDRFVWNRHYDLKIDGQPATLSIRLDGRSHTFHVAGETFDLSQGNFFRVKLMPGSCLIVEQFPVIDISEDDAFKVEARFASREKSPQPEQVTQAGSRPSQPKM